MLVIALAIRATSSGGALFRQPREGLAGRPFVMLKFRTMYSRHSDPNGDKLTRSCDPRVTPVGRVLRATSLDELPQLVNVLRGKMSIVGPRPHPPRFHFDGVLFERVIPDYALRHAVKPGMTGLAQISGFRGMPDNTDGALEMLRRRTQCDLAYVVDWSVPGDVRILFATAFALVRMRSY